jgi:hypothetical protein
MSWRFPFGRFTVATMTRLTAMDICVINFHWHTSFVVPSIHHAWLMTGLVTRRTPWIQLAGDETAYPSVVVSGIHVTQSFVFCVLIFLPLFVCFVLYRSAIVLSVLLQATVSDYSLVFSKLSFQLTFCTF